MAEEQKSAEDQLNDAVWQWAGRVVMVAVLVGVGYFGGYMNYGDAVKLRQENKTLSERITDLKNQRETASTRMARETRDKEVCRKDLKKNQDKLKDCQAELAAAKTPPVAAE